MIGVANDVTELHDGVLWYARTGIGIVVLFSPCIKWFTDPFGSSDIRFRLGMCLSGIMAKLAKRGDLLRGFRLTGRVRGIIAQTE